MNYFNFIFYFLCESSLNHLQIKLEPSIKTICCHKQFLLLPEVNFYNVLFFLSWIWSGCWKVTKKTHKTADSRGSTPPCGWEVKSQMLLHQYHLKLKKIPDTDLQLKYNLKIFTKEYKRQDRNKIGNVLKYKKIMCTYILFPVLGE